MASHSDASLSSLLLCPKCDGNLSASQAKNWCCHGCGLEIPIIDGIPWHFGNPSIAIAEWQLRMDQYYVSLRTEVETIKASLKQKPLSKMAEARLNRLLQGKVEQEKSVRKLLTPLAHDGVIPPGWHMLLGESIPLVHQLMGYYPNVFRDWAWGEEENAAALRLVLESKALTSAPPGVTAVLGAGAGRLAYDFHCAVGGTTIAVDINPFLLYAAQRVCAGRNLTLYEFPVAPVNGDSVALKRQCSAPEASDGNLHFVMADILQPLFQPQSLDYVITPWLIDVVSEPFAAFACRVNHMLKPGGIWLNFGALVFHQTEPAKCHSREEIPTLLEEAGFHVNGVKEDVVPYLQSPASAQRRFEKVFCFAATKTKDQSAPKPVHHLPAWLRDDKLPIPRADYIVESAGVHQLFNLIMSNIDGARSLSELAQFLAPFLHASPEQTHFIVRKLLLNLLEKTGTNQPF